MPTNAQLAEAHNAYSDKLVRQQLAEEKEVRAAMVAGYDPSEAIKGTEAAQLAAYDNYIAQYSEARKQEEEDFVVDGVDEEVKPTTP